MNRLWQFLLRPVETYMTHRKFVTNVYLAHECAKKNYHTSLEQRELLRRRNAGALDEDGNQRLVDLCEDMVQTSNTALKAAKIALELSPADERSSHQRAFDELTSTHSYILSSARQLGVVEA